MKSKKRKFIIVFITVVLILTTFAVAGTFAKYISQIDLADEARVAKWDINFLDKNNQKIVSLDLFRDSYFDKNSPVVKSLNGDKVVAPGTKGSYTFKIVGNAEVRYKINITVVDPVDTIGRIRYSLLDKDGNKMLWAPDTYDIKELAGYLENLYNYKGDYVPDESSDNYTEINNEHTIAWEWDYEYNGGDAPDDLIDSTDEVDTALGKQAVNDSSEAGYYTQAGVRMQLIITAEQVTNGFATAG